MIFSWFRSKKLGEHQSRFEQFLSLDDGAFVDVVADMIAQQHGASSAMCLVALQNVEPIIAGLTDYEHKNPGTNLPVTLEENVRVLAKALDENPLDEIGTRRRYWFVFSLMIKRATGICKASEAHRPSCVKLWCALIQGGQFLHSSLEHNVIWSDLEKEWFSPVKTEKDGMKFVLNYMMPDWLKKDSSIQRLAELADMRFVAGRYL